MSRTYTHTNKEGRNKNKSNTENAYDFLPEFEDYYREKMSKYGCVGKNFAIHSDVSGTTRSAESSRPLKDIMRKHPNSKRRSVLRREFTQTGVDEMGCWRNPYGDVYDRSFRMKGYRKEQSQRRRSRLKRITKNIIDDSYEDELLRDA